MITKTRIRDMDTETRLVYQVWYAMRNRCTNENHPAYIYYGGDGITVCKTWNSFWVFYEDMGPRPKGYTLERVDNCKGYNKENCRWVPRHENNRNRSFKLKNR